MTHSDPDRGQIGRRGFIGAASAGLLVPPAIAAVGGGIDPADWTPDYVRSIAGTVQVDTAAECDRVVKLNYTGRLTYWYVGPNEA